MPDVFVPVPSTRKLGPFTKIYNALQIVKRASRDKTGAGERIFLIRVATIMHFFTYANHPSLSFFFPPSSSLRAGFSQWIAEDRSPLLLLRADSFLYQRRRAYANLTNANLKGGGVFPGRRTFPGRSLREKGGSVIPGSESGSCW